MKPDRLFYSAAGAVFLVLVVTGFRHYIFGGTHVSGSPINKSILLTVVVHSSAIFAWYLLFFAQSLLITVKNRGLHMKTGWSVLAIAPVIAVTGPMVALHSTRLDPVSPVFEWTAYQFLLIMFAEIALFTVFVAIGVWNRKRPRIHRPMMLLACLAMLSGATGRIPLVNAIFGEHQWMALFGPVVAVGGVLLLVRWALARRLEREFAVGYAAFVVASFVVARLAVTETWVNWAAAIVKP